MVDALAAGDVDDHREELGDLLLQIVFQSELRFAEGKFGIDDVARGIVAKLVRRHPHVFGDVGGEGRRRGAGQLGQAQGGREGREGEARRARRHPRAARRPCCAPRAPARRRARSASTGPTPRGRARRSTRSSREFDEARRGGDRGSDAARARRRCCSRSRTWRASWGSTPSRRCATPPIASRRRFRSRGAGAGRRGPRRRRRPARRAGATLAGREAGRSGKVAPTRVKVPACDVEARRSTGWSRAGTPNRGKIEAARREAMYRAELEERPALLQRLGHAEGKARGAPGRQPGLGLPPTARARSRRARSTRSSTACSRDVRGTPAPRAERRNAMTSNRDPAARLRDARGGRTLAPPAAASTRKSTTRRSRTATRRKQKLAETQTALDKEKAQHKKDVDARDARVAVLTPEAESLGQDVSRLETERGNLGGELEQAQKRMEELQEGAGAGRGARRPVPQAGHAVQGAHRRGQAAGRDPREPDDRPPGRQDPVRPGQDRPQARGQGRAHAGDRGAQGRCRTATSRSPATPTTCRSSRRSSARTGICRPRAPSRC